ncbi:MAG: hypothetical protein ACLT98_09315 [Eggerthellaceae bacterium]
MAVGQSELPLYESSKRHPPRRKPAREAQTAASKAKTTLEREAGLKDEQAAQRKP